MKGPSVLLFIILLAYSDALRASSLLLTWWGSFGSTIASNPVTAPVGGLPANGTLIKVLSCGPIQVVVVRDSDLSNAVFFWQGTPTIGNWTIIAPSNSLWGTGGAQDVFCSSTGTIVLRSPLNQLWGAGSNSMLQLGSALGPATPLTNPQRLEYLFTPVFNSALDQVYCGPDYTLFSVNGDIYGVGRNDQNQLGLGALVSQADTPRLIVHVPLLVYLAPGWATGLLYTVVWGNNADGELCLGHRTVVRTPVINTVLPGLPTIFVQISRATRHTLFLDATQSVWGCGYNDAQTGLLGMGGPSQWYTVATRSNMTQVAGIKPRFIRTSDTVTLAVLCSNSIIVWGNNSFGQIPSLALGASSPVPSIVQTVQSPIAYYAFFFGSVAVESTNIILLTYPTNGAQPSILSAVLSSFLSFDLPTGGQVSPGLLFSLTNATTGLQFNLTYRYEEVTPDGTVVQTAFVAPGQFIVVPFGNADVRIFSLVGTLSNCAVVSLGITGFINPNNISFAGELLNYSSGDTKLTFSVFGWPYVSTANSVRWSLLFSSNAPLPLQATSFSLQRFYYVALTDPTSQTQIRVRTFTNALVSGPSDPFFVNASSASFGVSLTQPTSSIYQLQLVLPAGCSGCLVDPDISVLLPPTTTTTSTGLSTGAIVGIVVGCVAGAVLLGVLLAVVIAKMTKAQTARWDNENRARLKHEDLSNLRGVDEL